MNGRLHLPLKYWINTERRMSLREAGLKTTEMFLKRDDKQSAGSCLGLFSKIFIRNLKQKENKLNKQKNRKHFESFCAVAPMCLRRREHITLIFVAKSCAQSSNYLNFDPDVHWPFKVQPTQTQAACDIMKSDRQFFLVFDFVLFFF